MKNHSNFERGDIFNIFLPKTDLTPEHCPPPPDRLLHGIHKMICLTGHDEDKVPLGQVLMVPISTATSAVRKNLITDTHLPLEKEIFTFLDHNSYVLLFSPRPVDTSWLTQTNYVCNITDYDENAMKKIGILTLFANGSYDDVMEMAYERLKQRFMQEYLPPSNN
ncbi:hypothetical protein P4V54_03035 [Brevibacillus nitrificans]|uniref:hypothetical protein n=1 Tax=Brevibacillus nitrificans TaxID=651560 RepID=UPI002E1BDF1F|nr:hypothetical protein [Brevibacillus nitrificans]